jgi:hypothetical protein
VNGARVNGARDELRVETDEMCAAKAAASVVADHVRQVATNSHSLLDS